MQDFFKSIRFKLLAALLVVVFGFSLRATHDGTAMPMLSRMTGLLLTPVQRVTALLSSSVRDTLTPFLSAPRIADENTALRDENAALRQMLIEYERYKVENDQLRDDLEIKKEHPDFDFEPCLVIGRDTADRFYSFTIDKGTRDGVSVNDPVITGEGLVGLVSEVGPAHAKVLTILDAKVEIGAMDIVTREIGITTGSVELSSQGKLRLSFLPRDSTAKSGDLIATTGIGGLIPGELVVGIIEEVIPDGQGLSLYAVVGPVCDIRNLHDVLVIKHFEGQADAE